MTRILVVDDDLALADILVFALRRAGFDVLLAHEGRSGISLFNNQHPDMVILDWMLPDIDGLEVCKQLRLTSSVPIIMLTVRQADDDVVSALEAALADKESRDDYPYYLLEDEFEALALAAEPLRFDFQMHRTGIQRLPAQEGVGAETGGDTVLKNRQFDPKVAVDEQAAAMRAAGFFVVFRRRSGFRSAIHIGRAAGTGTDGQSQ